MNLFHLTRSNRQKRRPALAESALELARCKWLPLIGRPARTRMRAAGQGIGMADSYIAAIARAKGLIVATRDTQPFAAAGVPVINPWEAA